MTSTTSLPNPKASVLFFLALSSLAATVLSQDLRFRDGRFVETLGGVTLQRSDEASSDEAVRNMPFLPGDRVWTDESGRAEIVFADGEILWIAERSKVDSLGRGGDEQDERLGLRVFAGSFGARVLSGGPGFEFHAPGGSLTTTGPASFRVDVRAGETVVSVSDGEVLTELGGQRLAVRAGERVRYANRAVDGPSLYQRAGGDSFDRWCDERTAELNRMARDSSHDRLPDELDQYGDELDRNGEWVYDEPQGYVFVPRVAYDWAPYTYGRWVYTLYGWTWVADEPWGFVTSHYGRWGYSSRIGWHWMPRSGFAGAWVAWSTPLGPWGHTIGWCALGFNDRPVGSLGYGSGGRAVPRSNSAGRGWSFANRSDIGRANIHRRRVNLPVGELQRAAVWSADASPDRQLRESRSDSVRRGARGGSSIGEAVGVRRDEGRSGGTGNTGARIYVRPSPGDSTPELRSDPTTTLPTPESRRGRTIGQDGFKDEQDNRKGRSRPNSYVFSADETGASPANESPRVRSDAPLPTTSSDPARTDSNRATPRRDPLLSRFFRSITSQQANPEPPTRADDASAGRSSPREGSAVRGLIPREAPRPSEARPRDQNQERPRPAGVDRSQPRSSPPPKASPREGGSAGGRAERRRPPKDN